MKKYARAKIGTCGIQKCAFCKYWIGEAKITWIDIGVCRYNQDANGICKLHQDRNWQAGNVCSNIEVEYMYL